MHEEQWSPWSGIVGDPARTGTWRRLVGEQDREIRAFLQFEPDSGLDLAASFQPTRYSSPTPEDAHSRLAGIPFAVKDNIAVRGFRLTCGP